MTMQTFEVQFTDQAGMNLKQFSRLLRFGHALQLKMHNLVFTGKTLPTPAVSLNLGHLIKDFKEFTFLAPGEFMKQLHPLLERFECL